ncbi:MULTISPECIES: heme-degrading domain-containing protein [unclassified Mesorhizobium]|uniref:heme-degrading domain-containing protein n=1 Tax=unclassified Mesorhizobium TaxID=325217 RepID=UPI000FCA8526|nr:MULTISPECIES: heme-degrading domain-containing protein [unclassified Mesorhizobium]RUU90936.1 heme-degrading domain-containing protein [Mesorhizobium sp. M7A.F.Ca.MR.176.00.0.0]RVD66540.1 heme-degrading domain-containing protein [Mesorhizobium sp. M7A.F.Ca.ET.027.03.2.1]RWP07027.1 MAG: heme-degrading domain-containing protein [Mesorhizobium sp.]RWP86415.1 MAG: heme-degrading domain-containing protein [Mesorhizobium sp.]RWP89348.1 MAG: heme-degrading domain-containing protein [Mesorhizobium 
MADDIETIKRQEATLVFSEFDEAIAFEIGTAIRDRALAGNLPIIVDIRTFDRPLFYAALPGSNASNPDWARRKINVVKRFLRSTYRMVLEQQRPDRSFKIGEGLDIADYVLAGGGFPVTVKGAGVIGVIAVSGLPEREDHGVVVDALCDHLGVDKRGLALPRDAE